MYRSPFDPWNSHQKDEPFAPLNNQIKKDNPFSCWNNPFGNGKYKEEVEEYERKHGRRR